MVSLVRWLPGHQLSPRTKEGTVNQRCSWRTTAGFGTKFRDNDGRVGLDLFYALFLFSILIPTK